MRWHFNLYFITVNNCNYFSSIQAWKQMGTVFHNCSRSGHFISHSKHIIITFKVAGNRGQWYNKSVCYILQTQIKPKELLGMNASKCTLDASKRLVYVHYKRASSQTQKLTIAKHTWSAQCSSVPWHCQFSIKKIVVFCLNTNITSLRWSCLHRFTIM